MRLQIFSRAPICALMALSLGNGCIAQSAERVVQAETCAPLGLEKAALMSLRESGFKFEDENRRDAFAVGVVACLGDIDPELRDGVGYEGLSALLRSETLSDETVIELGNMLMLSLEAPADPAGVRHPFAVLALSEVARADRVGGIMSAEQRAQLVTRGAAYLRSVNDYRGFSDEEGWRHGVAHASDLMMQLVLNEAVTREQLDEILNAVASQIIPGDNHFYIFGEPERLARPVIFAALRGEVTDEDWTAWFNSISDPAPFQNWADVYASEQGLARRHNLNAFAQAIYVQSAASGREDLVILETLALGILRELS